MVLFLEPLAEEHLRVILHWCSPCIVAIFAIELSFLPVVEASLVSAGSKFASVIFEYACCTYLQSALRLTKEHPVHLPRDEGKLSARPFSIVHALVAWRRHQSPCSRPVSLQVHRTRGVVRIWNSCATNHDFPALSAKTDRHDLDSHVFRGFDRLKKFDERQATDFVVALFHRRFFFFFFQTLTVRWKLRGFLRRCPAADQGAFLVQNSQQQLSEKKQRAQQPTAFTEKRATANRHWETSSDPNRSSKSHDSEHVRLFNTFNRLLLTFFFYCNLWTTCSPMS